MKEASYTFKNSSDIKKFHLVRLELQAIFLDLCKYCQMYNLPRPTITSTIRKKMPWSKSTTHEEGRAIDVRSMVYTIEEKTDMLEYMNKTWARKYGTAPTGKDPKVMIWEGKSAGGEHFHLQVRKY